MLQSAVRKLGGIRKIYYGWAIVAIVSLNFSVAFAIQFSFGIFFKPLQDTFGWSRAATSWAMTIHLITFALFMLPVARSLDRFGARKLYAVAALVVGASLALCSRISEPWQFYLLYGVILGVGISAYGPAPTAIVARWFKEKRGLALGISSSGVGFGTLVGAPLANSLIEAYGWRDAFLILGIGSFVILLASAYFIRGAPPAAGSRDSEEQKKHSNLRPSAISVPPTGMTLGQALRTKELFLIMAGHSSFTLAVKMTMVHIARYGIDVGISAPVAALATGAIGGMSMVGRLAMGLVQDKMGPRRSIFICMIVQAASMFALPFIRSDMLFFAYAIGFGFAYGGDVPQYPALTAQYFGIASIAVMYSFLSTIGNIAGAIGPIAAGYAFDLTGSYTIVFVGSAMLLLFGLACVWRLPSRD